MISKACYLRHELTTPLSLLCSRLRLASQPPPPMLPGWEREARSIGGHKLFVSMATCG